MTGKLRVRLRGWSRLGQVQRVDLYTRQSLYVLVWSVGLLALAGMAPEDWAPASPAVAVAVAIALSLALCAAATVALRAVASGVDGAPPPWTTFAPVVVLAVVALALVPLVPQPAQWSAILEIAAAVGWAFGGVRDRRVLAVVAVTLAVGSALGSGSWSAGVFAVSTAAFLAFTVRSSLWLYGIVAELDRARRAEGALAVAEERLRFSRDVHDVLGRRLSEIAVQAELAAALARRGDAGAEERMLDVRSSAHDALREARALARGYRPPALLQELDGAGSLLRSAGIDWHADVAGLPPQFAELAASVVREGVTNVLRHSQATRVDLVYSAGELVLGNDGAGEGRTTGGGLPPDGGAGLRGLAERVSAGGGALDVRRADGAFELRVRLPEAPQPLAAR